jgi:hypothetical protein
MKKRSRHAEMGPVGVIKRLAAAYATRQVYTRNRTDLWPVALPADVRLYAVLQNTRKAARVVSDNFNSRK